LNLKSIDYDWSTSYGLKSHCRHQFVQMHNLRCFWWKNEFFLHRNYINDFNCTPYQQV